MPIIISTATRDEERSLRRAGLEVSHLDRFQIYRMFEVDPGDPPRGERFVFVAAPVPLGELLKLPEPPEPGPQLRLVR